MQYIERVVPFTEWGRMLESFQYKLAVYRFVHHDVVVYLLPRDAMNLYLQPYLALATDDGIFSVLCKQAFHDSSNKIDSGIEDKTDIQDSFL